MTLITSELHVQQLTTDVKAALAKYPSEGARIQKAAYLVCDGHVTLHGDGSATVRSATDANVTYTVNGGCTCQAAQHGMERCAHKYARTFARRLALLDKAELAVDCSVENRDRLAGVEVVGTEEDKVMRTDRYGKPTGETFTLTRTIRKADPFCESIAARVCCPENRIAWWVGGHSPTAGH